MTIAEGEQRLHGRTVAVSSVDKVLFPADGITKGRLVEYYDRIAETALPYLRDRPVALKRFPDGLDRPGFFQKSASDHFPDWLGSVDIARRDGGTTHNLVVTEAAALPYLADQGTIEFHSWLARADRLEQPDQLVLDLDPPGEDVDAARAATRRVWDLLVELGLEPLCKTSGSKGYHVHVLVDRDDGVDTARMGADLARLLALRHPDELTDAQRKAKRRGRVLVDHFRNRFAQTVVAPYSVRARPGAPVSVPIEWRELGDVAPQRYDIDSVLRRLAQRDDPWSEPWSRGGVSLADAREQLDALLADAERRR